MSDWHRLKGFDKGTSQKARAVIAQLLPSPCIDCGKPVYPHQQWHVGHRIPISDPRGTNELWNLGPSHARCNTAAGGRMGAKRTNEQKREERRMPSW